MLQRDENIIQDLRRYVPTARKLNLRILLATIFRQPGFLTCLLYRAMDDRYRKGRIRRAQLLYLINLWTTGADLVPGCQIGPGLLIRHASGIVVGVGVAVGSGCTILQQVTLGAANAGSRDPQEYPIVGENVTLGAGSKIIGGVKIGDGATVGANSVVTRDVPCGVTVVGAPARPVHAV